jgi:membrane protein YdbS with pleckstrin-like domain
MQCPACGTEVVPQAIYCHKCGERLAQDESLSPGAPAETGGVGTPSLPPTMEKAATGGTLPAEKLKAAVAANHAAEDEPEQELWKGGYSSKAMIGNWVITGLITITLLAAWIAWLRRFEWTWLAVLIVIGLLWLYQLSVLTHRRMNVRYLLTTQRFLFEKGLLRRVTDCIEVVEISDITFEQGPLERLVGVGTIRVVANDRSSPEVVMPGIENVKEVSRTMDEVRRNERRRRGLHIEQI